MKKAKDSVVIYKENVHLTDKTSLPYARTLRGEISFRCNLTASTSENNDFCIGKCKNNSVKIHVINGNLFIGIPNRVKTVLMSRINTD